MDEIIIVALKNGQIMIGKPDFDQKVKRLVSPRIILITGDTQIQLLEIFGAPDYIELVETPIYTGPVTDKEMIRGYVQATTSLVIPN